MVQHTSNEQRQTEPRPSEYSKKKEALAGVSEELLTSWGVGVGLWDHFFFSLDSAISLVGLVSCLVIAGSCKQGVILAKAQEMESQQPTCHFLQLLPPKDGTTESWRGWA